MLRGGSFREFLNLLGTFNPRQLIAFVQWNIDVPASAEEYRHWGQEIADGNRFHVCHGRIACKIRNQRQLLFRRQFERLFLNFVPYFLVYAVRISRIGRK